MRGAGWAGREKRLFEGIVPRARQIRGWGWKEWAEWKRRKREERESEELLHLLERLGLWQSSRE